MEIPIAMIVACRLLPFRANRLANIIAGAICTLVNGSLTFVPPLFGARTPALPEYLFFATIETVCTSVIIWQAWTWSTENAGRTLGRSGDNGVDGVIDQDALGLDRVYIQAKRYADGNNVGPGEIRDFFGSLDRHKVRRAYS
jgi:hypothetical protein